MPDKRWFIGGGGSMTTLAVSLFASGWPEHIRAHPVIVGGVAVLGLLGVLYGFLFAPTSSKSPKQSIKAGRDNFGSQYSAGRDLIVGERRSKREVDGISENDPLVYIDLERGQLNKMEDFIVCHNRGKTTAHDIQVQSIALSGKPISFSIIHVLGQDEKAKSSPLVGGAGSLQRWFSYWLKKDWDEKGVRGGSISEEWRIPFVVTYSDALGAKKFVCTTELIYYPVKHHLSERAGKFRDTFWAFSSPQFKADSQ